MSLEPYSIGRFLFWIWEKIKDAPRYVQIPVGIIIISLIFSYYLYDKKNKELENVDFQNIKNSYQGIISQKMTRLSIDSIEEITKPHFFKFKYHLKEPYSYNGEGSLHPVNPVCFWKKEVGTIIFKDMINQKGYIYYKESGKNIFINVRFPELNDSSYLRLNN